MPTDGTRLQRVGYFGHKLAEAEANTTAREWWDAACGLLPAVVLAVGCLTGAYWWMTNEVVHAAAAEPTRPAVQALRPVSKSAAATAENQIRAGRPVRPAELHRLVANAQRSRRPAPAAASQLAENRRSATSVERSQPNAAGSTARSIVQLQAARVVAIDDPTEPSEEQPEPVVPADATPLLAIPVPTVLEQAPPAPPTCWQPGNRSIHKSWNCPAIGASKQEPKPPAPLIRD